MIIDQTTRDDSICSLLSKMDEVYTFLVKAELRDIESMKAVGWGQAGAEGPELVAGSDDARRKR